MTTQTQHTPKRDYRQRFFIDGSVVRGDVVNLTDAYQTGITQKDYPFYF